MKLLEQTYKVLDKKGIKALKQHPKNANKADKQALRESLDKVGFYGAVIVQKSTGFILAGNHRVQEALEQEAERLPVIFLNVGEDAALRILAGDNRIARLGEDDPQAIADLLAELGGGGNLQGTGYMDGDLKRLLEELKPAAPPPEFPSYDGDLKTDHECPKCGYSWSGKAQ